MTEHLLGWVPLLTARHLSRHRPGMNAVWSRHVGPLGMT